MKRIVAPLDKEWPWSVGSGIMRLREGSYRVDRNESGTELHLEAKWKPMHSQGIYCLFTSNWNDKGRDTGSALTRFPVWECFTDDCIASICNFHINKHKRRGFHAFEFNWVHTNVHVEFLRWYSSNHFVETLYVFICTFHSSFKAITHWCIHNITVRLFS